MTTKCCNRDQFVRELDGHLEIIQSPETKYSLDNALLDLTGFGTIYQIGSDFAHLARTNRVLEWLQENDQFTKGSFRGTVAKTTELVLRERSERKISIASKCVFLGSLASLISLPYTLLSAAGCIGSGAYFMLKAGFSGNDRMTAVLIKSLRNQLA